jgi:hypothetical protein
VLADYLFLDKFTVRVAVFQFIKQSTILRHVRHSSGNGLSFSRFFKYPKWCAHPGLVSFSTVVVFFAWAVVVGGSDSWMVFRFCVGVVFVMHLGHA